MPIPTTTLLPVPLAPEISLHLVDGPVGLFDLTGGEFRSDEPPPFWAFVWAGGQALARYVLDHPAMVAGRHVHDLATGSGVAAIAAAKAGARTVTVSDVDPAAVAAAHRNAAANQVVLTSPGGAGPAGAGPAGAGPAGAGPGIPAGSGDVAPGSAVAADAARPEVILAGDVFYSRTVADQMVAELRRYRRESAAVLVGDPGRGYFPVRLFEQVAEYVVPVPVALEETESLTTAVWRMR